MTIPNPAGSLEKKREPLSIFCSIRSLIQFNLANLNESNYYYAKKVLSDLCNDRLMVQFLQ